MTNPIAQLRKEANLSQKSLSSIAGVTEQVVSRTELGTFGEIPPSIVEALITLDKNLDVMQLNRDYDNWIESEIKKCRLPDVELDPSERTSVDDWIEWRMKFSVLNRIPGTVISFCGKFKIHPYVISKWEKGRMAQIPDGVIDRVKLIRRQKAS